MIGTAETAVFLHLFARMAGWLWFDPLARRLPRPARLFAAAALAAALTPGTAPVSWSADGAGVLQLAVQFGQGALLALVVHAVVAVAGMAFAWAQGAAASAWLPPQAGETDALGAAGRQLAWWLAVLAFVGAGGHLLVVEALRDSVLAVPLDWPADGVQRLALDAPAWLLLAGLKLALPMLVLVLLGQLASGLALRHAAGADLWHLGLGVGVAGLLLAWIVAVPLVAPLIVEGVARMHGWMRWMGG